MGDGYDSQILGLLPGGKREEGRTTQHTAFLVRVLMSHVRAVCRLSLHQNFETFTVADDCIIYFT
jgi:hypothetical protein